jgi:hypothetical protein
MSAESARLVQYRARPIRSLSLPAIASVAWQDVVDRTPVRTTPGDTSTESQDRADQRPRGTTEALCTARTVSRARLTQPVAFGAYDGNSSDRRLSNSRVETSG